VIFVDTGAWFASMVRNDANHAIAAARLAPNKEQLITSDDILSETITLLVMRGQRQVAEAFGTAIFSGKLARLHLVTPDEVQAAWQVFLCFQDKEWSFVDCTIEVVMEKLGIQQAFSFDHHFRQFGTIVVVPQQDTT
jgi:predicted nucleic acid-binding protein